MESLTLLVIESHVEFYSTLFYVQELNPLLINQFIIK